MASFSAQLRVAGHVFPVLHCSYHTSQATNERGRVSAKVRHHPVELVLDVPDLDILLAWAAAPHKRQATDIVFLDATSRNALETLHMAGAYCVSYRENFVSGNVSTGAYQCHITLSDPSGFIIHNGGPASAFVSPAAGVHGTPQTASTLASIVTSRPPSNCPPAVTAMLQQQVDLMCKSRGMSSKCLNADNCNLLLQKVAMKQACIKARLTINNQCFNGGDPGHKQAITEQEAGIDRCLGIYSSQCIKGGKPVPIPKPVPTPVPSPSSTPSQQPDAGKYGPTTLAGAALIIYIILTAPFRTVPN